MAPDCLSHLAIFRNLFRVEASMPLVFVVCRKGSPAEALGLFLPRAALAFAGRTCQTFLLLVQTPLGLTGILGLELVDIGFKFWFVLIHCSPFLFVLGAPLDAQPPLECFHIAGTGAAQPGTFVEERAGLVLVADRALFQVLRCPSSIYYFIASRIPPDLLFNRSAHSASNINHCVYY